MKLSLEEACQRLKEKDEELTKVDLSGQAIGDAGITTLAFALKQQNHLLLELHLGSAGLSASGVKTLSKHLPTSLQKLYLQSNSVGNVGAQAIAQFYLSQQGHSNLQLLNLSGNRIGDVGAAALAEALLDSSLCKLYLYDNQIGQLGATALAETIVAVNSTLQEVFIWDNCLGEEGIRKLKTAAQTVWKEQGREMQLRTHWKVEQDSRPNNKICRQDSTRSSNIVVVDTSVPGSVSELLQGFESKSLVSPIKLPPQRRLVSASTFESPPPSGKQPLRRSAKSLDNVAPASWHPGGKSKLQQLPQPPVMLQLSPSEGGDDAEKVKQKPDAAVPPPLNSSPTSVVMDTAAALPEKDSNPQQQPPPPQDPPGDANDEASIEKLVFSEKYSPHDSAPFDEEKSSIVLDEDSTINTAESSTTKKAPRNVGNEPGLSSLMKKKKADPPPSFDEKSHASSFHAAMLAGDGQSVSLSSSSSQQQLFNKSAADLMQQSPPRVAAELKETTAGAEATPAKVATPTTKEASPSPNESKPAAEPRISEEEEPRLSLAARDSLSNSLTEEEVEEELSYGGPSELKPLRSASTTGISLSRIDEADPDVLLTSAEGEVSSTNATKPQRRASKNRIAPIVNDGSLHSINSTSDGSASRRQQRGRSKQQQQVDNMDKSNGSSTSRSKSTTRKLSGSSSNRKSGSGQHDLEALVSPRKVRASSKATARTASQRNLGLTEVDLTKPARRPSLNSVASSERESGDSARQQRKSPQRRASRTAKRSSSQRQLDAAAKAAPSSPAKTSKRRPSVSGAGAAKEEKTKRRPSVSNGTNGVAVSASSADAADELPVQRRPSLSGGTHAAPARPRRVRRASMSAFASSNMPDDAPPDAGFCVEPPALAAVAASRRARRPSMSAVSASPSAGEPPARASRRPSASAALASTSTPVAEEEVAAPVPTSIATSNVNTAVTTKRKVRRRASLGTLTTDLPEAGGGGAQVAGGSSTQQQRRASSKVRKPSTTKLEDKVKSGGKSSKRRPSMSSLPAIATSTSGELGRSSSSRHSGTGVISGSDRSSGRVSVGAETSGGEENRESAAAAEKSPPSRSKSSNKVPSAASPLKTKNSRTAKASGSESSSPPLNGDLAEAPKPKSSGSPNRTKEKSVSSRSSFDSNDSDTESPSAPDEVKVSVNFSYSSNGASNDSNRFLQLVLPPMPGADSNSARSRESTGGTPRGGERKAMKRRATLQHTTTAVDTGNSLKENFAPPKPSPSQAARRKSFSASAGIDAADAQAANKSSDEKESNLEPQARNSGRSSRRYSLPNMVAVEEEKAEKEEASVEPVDAAPSRERSDSQDDIAVDSQSEDDDVDNTGSRRRATRRPTWHASLSSSAGSKDPPAETSDAAMESGTPPLSPRKSGGMWKRRPSFAAAACKEETEPKDVLLDNVSTPKKDRAGSRRRMSLGSRMTSLEKETEGSRSEAFLPEQNGSGDVDQEHSKPRNHRRASMSAGIGASSSMASPETPGKKGHGRRAPSDALLSPGTSSRLFGLMGRRKSVSGSNNGVTGASTESPMTGKSPWKQRLPVRLGKKKPEIVLAISNSKDSSTRSEEDVSGALDDSSAHMDNSESSSQVDGTDSIDSAVAKGVSYRERLRAELGRIKKKTKGIISSRSSDKTAGESRNRNQAKVAEESTAGSSSDYAERLKAETERLRKKRAGMSVRKLNSIQE